MAFCQENREMYIKILSNLCKIFVLFVMALLCNTNVYSQTYEFQGMLSGWITANNDEDIKAQLGFRYIPRFSLEQSISQNYSLNVELSLNAYGAGYFRSIDNVETDGKIKPYRMWFRFSSSQFEARLGLQKINFGTATLLRPLMWFDRIDPRDPLQITDGVYGLLFRYYFLNNTNIWVWGLYGNDETKGLEINPTTDNSIEYGGRLQLPLFSGEIAFTYHHRQAEINKELLLLEQNSAFSFPENRIAIDGKWDAVIGLWFEGTLEHQNSAVLPFPWRRALNIGLDYTFGLGNGLYAAYEHFILEMSEETFSSGEQISFSAMLINYPLGLMDTIRGIVYYDWENHELYRFVNWQRTYDRWSFYIMGFWNPEQFLIYQSKEMNNLFTGKGFQFMVVFNH
jgi:hypothetical protein